MLEGVFTIRNRLGLHARAAAMFVKSAAKFNSNVLMEKDGMQVNGKSIMGLLMLACPLGSKIVLRAEGEDEEKAFQELGDLINNGFNEE
ncbi:MAG: HPr family phosphocarrier protein [Syntrophorhabdaceae bacterium]|nr:HPr family phosphocarrier protein [Syntrophorhabdaceae bacterium]MDD4195102.1 HPr family phosphocarrier protein [Syntrophorhabdaceae bacterium]HOC45559.1 HPr family phosphocarrier protein [Syntrophorhabdaceae bacterium]